MFRIHTPLVLIGSLFMLALAACSSKTADSSRATKGSSNAVMNTVVRTVVNTVTTTAVAEPIVSEAHSELQIDEVSMELSFPHPGELNARLGLSFQPRLKRQGSDGNVIVEGLSQGKISMRAQLVASHGESVGALHSPIEVGEISLNGSAARWQGEAKLTSLPPRDSLLELRFEASAIGLTRAVRPVRGRVSLGRLTSQMLQHVGTVQPASAEGLFFTPVTPSTNPQAGNRSWAFRAGKIKAERVEVLKLDGLGKPSLVEYQLLACLKNSLSLEPVLGERFRLRSDAGSEERSTDTDSGCIRWKHKIEFGYTSMPTPIRSEITIEGLSGFYAGGKETRALHFLPWQIDTGDSIIDEQFDGAPSPTTVAEGGQPELLVKEAACRFKGRTFGLDVLLNLGTVRRYRCTLVPAIRRLTRASGWLPPESVTSGRFRVRYLLETTDLQDPRVIDAREVEAEAIAGQIQSDVDFRFPDLAQVMGRLQLSIELLPLDASLAVKTQPVSDSISLLEGGVLAPAPRKSSLQARMALVPALTSQRDTSVDFAAAFGLVPLPSAKSDFAQAAVLLAKGDDSALGRLCELFYEPPRYAGIFSAHRRCLARPADYLTMARTRHVITVEKAALEGAPESLSVSMQAGFSVSSTQSKSRSSTYSHGVDVGVSGGGEVPLLNLVGVKLGASVRYGTSWSNSESTSFSDSTGNSQGVSVSRSLNVDKARFRVQAQVRQCVTITAKGDKKAKSFFHCAPGSDPASFAETYFFLYDQATGSALVDPSAPATQRPFVALIRGQDRFQAFVRVLEDKSRAVSTDGKPRLPDGLRAVMPAGANDGLFPGLVNLGP